jgi:cytochrome c
MSIQNKLFAIALLACLMPAAVVAEKLGGEALLGEKRCVACHDVSRNLLGPPYKAIAARHAAQKDTMVEVLAQKIIAGGAGNWGVVPMVPNEHVSLDEARAMSRWILGLQQ